LSASDTLPLCRSVPQLDVRAVERELGALLRGAQPGDGRADVFRHHEAAAHRTAAVEVGGERGLRVAHLAVQPAFVMEAGAAAAQRALEVRPDLRVLVLAEHLAHRAPGDLGLGLVQPVLVGAVVEGEALLGVDVADQRRRVVDQAVQPLAVVQQRRHLALVLRGFERLNVGALHARAQQHRHRGHDAEAEHPEREHPGVVEEMREAMRRAERKDEVSEHHRGGADRTRGAPERAGEHQEQARHAERPERAPTRGQQELDRGDAA
jgi:hypothetical protein